MAALLSLALYLGLSRYRPQSSLARPAALELALISTLYAAWRLARQIPLGSDDLAIERAHDLVALQQALHLPTELAVQTFVLDHAWLGRPSTLYYAVMHVPTVVGFLVWLFVRHRDRYPHWRNALALVTAGCLAIRWIRVAPPRYLTDLGYQDLSEIWGPSVYGEVGSGVSDQFTAMPSIHVGWAAVVSFGIFACSRSRWRWLFLLHVVITTLVVVDTGHHWWLDGIVAVLLLVLALTLDTTVRRAFAVVRSRRAPSELESLEPSESMA